MANYLFNFTKKGASKDQSLREQACRLLRTGLWGIGDKTANKSHLAPGDLILAYVGAPERLFVGSATLSSGFHQWTDEEAARYPGGFTAGVSFGEASLLDPPVPIETVWREMPSSAKNPNAQFFGGVVQIKQEDLEAVLREGANNGAPNSPESGQPLASPTANPFVDALFDTTEKLREFVAAPHEALSEDGTRAFFIDPFLSALGYTDFGDIEHGVQVESKDFADYVLRIDSSPAIVVEAKKLGAPLGAEQAAQVVKYASVLGVRWGVVTDGQVVKVYDAPIPGVPPKDRLVFELDLSSYSDREDFEIGVYPDAALIGKEAMTSGLGLERRAAQEAARELLTTEGTASVTALQTELQEKKLTHMTPEQVADLVAELLG